MGILGNAMSGGRWVSATALGEYERTRLYKADSSDRGKCHSPFVPSDCLLPSEPEVLGKRVRDWWMSPECSPGNVRFSSKLLPAASADDHVLLWGCARICHQFAHRRMAYLSVICWWLCSKPSQKGLNHAIMIQKSNQGTSVRAFPNTIRHARARIVDRLVNFVGQELKLLRRISAKLVGTPES